MHPQDGSGPTRSTAAPDLRRPGYHFTVPAGWINDPLGVTWRATPDGGRYELFYQLNPASPVWAQACHWGQASSPDLVRWQDPRVALAPGPAETGCWSGSVVVDDGRPVIVYTSVLADAPGMGRVALAEGDAEWRRWTSDPTGPVLPAPDPALGLAHVRDPFVWRDGDEWRMLLGAGSTGGRPSVLQYSSADLRRWRPDGVLAEPTEDQPGPGGTVWECPQLFRLDGSWVLMVSVWDEEPGGVACAVGDYDGRRFTPRAWHRLAGDLLYATTTFLDAAGRRSALSWVQEPGPAAGAWAGALTTPWLLGLDGDRVVVRPHPDVDSLRTGAATGPGPVDLGPEPLVARSPGPTFDLVLRAAPPASRITLTLTDDDGPLMSVLLDPAAGETVVSGAAPARTVAPFEVTSDGAVELRMLVDDCVAELFPTGGAVLAARLRPFRGPVQVTVAADADADADADGVRLERMDLHAMERVVP